MILTSLSIDSKCWAALYLIETSLNLKLPPEYKLYCQAFYCNEGNGFVFTIRGKNPLNPAFHPISKDFNLTMADDENAYHVSIIGHMMGGFVVTWWMSSEKHDELSHPTRNFIGNYDYRNHALDDINNAVQSVVGGLANGLDELIKLHTCKEVHNT